MEVICKTCDTRLNIPDEKIPKGQRVSASCPKCKATLSMEFPEKRAVREVSQVGTKPETAGRVKRAEYDYGDEDSSLDLYEEGLKLALLMESDPDQLEKLKRAVEEIGYRAVLAANTRDAVGKMRFHHFELVVLSDSFDGIDLAQSPVINYLNRLSMSIRRRMFLALVGDGFKTLDEMKAFAMSANAVINRKDLDKTTSILKKAIVDNVKFYKVFMDTLAEVGRA